MKHPLPPLLAGRLYFLEGYTRLLGLIRPELARILRAAKPFTLMSARNLTMLHREGRRTLAAGVEGVFMEIGVHRGGSAAILAELIKDQPDRHLHLFDRWGDLPEPTEQDGFRAEEYRRDRIADKLAELSNDPPFAATKHLIEEIVKFPTERVHYHPGWYSETLGQYSGGPIAFVSLDCDYYESVRLALDFIDRHAAAAATIVADDYGFWPGVKTAIEEWAAQTRRKVRIQPLSTGPAVLRLQG